MGGTTRTILAAAAVATACALPACDTVSEDVSFIARTMFPPSPGEAARQAIDPHNPDHRREGTLLLANAPFGGNPEYLRMYRDYVENERDPLVKAVAIRALARHGTPEDALLIAPHLLHENEQVRWEAAKGLQRLHNPQVVGNLITTLNRVDEKTEVRIAAARAMAQYPEDRVFQALVAALDARDLALNIAAERSLRTLTGRGFDRDRKAWFAWYNAYEGDPFAGGSEYRYHTYHRNETWLESLAFWSSRIEEQPAPPAGLEPEGTRRTYEDDEAGG